MMRRWIYQTALVCAVLVAAQAGAQDGAKPFIGNWSFTTPDNGAGWIGIEMASGNLQGSILWIGGSPVPLANLYVDKGALHAVRVDGKYVYVSYPELDRVKAWPLTMHVSGDAMHCEMTVADNEGTGHKVVTFKAERMPALPDKPDLSAIEYGQLIELIAADSLDGWAVMGDNPNGWRVEDGVLINDAKQPESGEHIRYANIRTEQEFNDFNLQLEVQVPEDGNSGVYLRGVYEIQVADSFEDKPSTHTMGALYGRVAPDVSAEKAPGEWQSMDITLVDRHVTVVLNGETVIDNAPIPGVTGGALWANGLKPGPIYLQGDHGSIKYRNVVLRAVIDK